MRMLTAAFVLNTIVLTGYVAVAVPVRAAAPVPCENMLKDMRAAKQTAKLSAADMAKVDDLEKKGVERCNADDDVRADKFLADAMKIMGK